VRKTVNSSSLIKTVSTNHLLIPMILALDEARLVNSIVASKEMIKDIKAKDPYSDRLIHLKREIRQFETELVHVRKLTDRKKLLSKA
jgi:hypothetical protein